MRPLPLILNTFTSLFIYLLNIYLLSVTNLSTVPAISSTHPLCLSQHKRPSHSTPLPILLHPVSIQLLSALPLPFIAMQEACDPLLSRYEEAFLDSAFLKLHPLVLLQLFFLTAALKYLKIGYISHDFSFLSQTSPFLYLLPWNRVSKAFVTQITFTNICGLLHSNIYFS